MSTADHTTTRPAALPPLVAGQRLDQPTFHARYAAMPPGTWAELVDGVVFMSSPVGDDHARSHLALGYWVMHYLRCTPGVDALDNASTTLGVDSEVQPDVMLRVREESGGQTTVDRHLIRGAPELVIEVSHSSRGLDLGPKLTESERAGVLEYVVRTWGPEEIRWHRLNEGRLVGISPDVDGLFRSRAFPGLWLDPRALLANDVRRIQDVVEQGLATAEHAAFVASLAARRG